MDFQDVAWYMSALYFTTPEVQSLFSEFGRFEYSQLYVESFAHEQERYDPSPQDTLADLESTRTTAIEMKN